MRILVVHPAFLGDTVFLGPGVRALKARWPESRVALCVTPRGAPIARLLPGCDEVIAYDKRGRDRGAGGLLRTGKRLRALRPDIAVVSHPSLRSGLLAWLSRAPRRVGYAPLCTERLKQDRDQPFPGRLLACTEHLGASGDGTLKLNGPPPQPGDCPELGRRTALSRREGERWVGLVPGAERATKRWGAAKFIGLTQALMARGLKVVLLGGPMEQALAHDVKQGASHGVLDTTGSSIGQALEVIAQCDVVIGGDTGLVHCARALGRKTVILFGPTPVTRHVFGPLERAVFLSLDCQPCHASGPRRCPLGHHRCMKDLPLERVLAEVFELVGPQ